MRTGILIQDVCYVIPVLDKVNRGVIEYIQKFRKGQHVQILEEQGYEYMVRGASTLMPAFLDKQIISISDKNSMNG